MLEDTYDFFLTRSGDGRETKIGSGTLQEVKSL